MIRPMILLPFRNTYKFTASQIFNNKIPLTPIVNGDTVTVYEIIKIQISSNTGLITVFSTKPWSNAQVVGFTDNTKNIVLAYQHYTSGNQYATTQTYDLSDGRGNGTIYPLDTLYFSVSPASNATFEVGYNLFVRQRDISMQEYIQTRESFSS